MSRGVKLDYCLGGTILDIKRRLLSYIVHKLTVIYLHVGGNNLRRGYRGVQDTMAGYDKRETLHNMADLCIY